MLFVSYFHYYKFIIFILSPFPSHMSTISWLYATTSFLPPSTSYLPLNSIIIIILISCFCHTHIYQSCSPHLSLSYTLHLKFTPFIPLTPTQFTPFIPLTPTQFTPFIPLTPTQYTPFILRHPSNLPQLSLTWVSPQSFDSVPYRDVDGVVLIQPSDHLELVSADYFI